MNNFFKTPHLPDKKVSLALCGKIDNEIISFINEQGIELIFSETCAQLDNPVSNHIDLVAHHAGRNNIIINKNNIELYKILSDIGMNVFYTHKEIKSPYPDDCLLNCFKINNALFCKNNITDNTIKDIYTDALICNVKQGYCKCSVLIISDNAFITDDISIYKKACDNNFDCLLIEKGDIQLDGYNYGFIGGASAKIDKNIILFFGDIRKHRNYNEIAEFLLKHNMKFIFSNKFNLTDIGGIIPLK